jgi:hypothetical protein
VVAGAALFGRQWWRQVLQIATREVSVLPKATATSGMMHRAAESMKR